MAPSTYEVFFSPQNRLVTLKLIRYSMWMLLAPLATFYFLFVVVFKNDKAMLGWCGIAAVIAANCVIASYVVMAWNEDKNDKKQDGSLAKKQTTIVPNNNNSEITNTSKIRVD